MLKDSVSMNGGSTSMKEYMNELFGDCPEYYKMCFPYAVNRHVGRVDHYHYE